MVQASASLRSSKRSERPSRRPGRWRRVLLWLVAGGVGLVGLTYWAVHRFEWAGPLVANSLRAVIGVDNVAHLEDLVYAVEDRLNRFTRKNEKPQAHWQVPAAVTATLATAASASAAAAGGAPALPPFAPADPGPWPKAWSAPGDGKWVPMLDPRRPGEPPYMMKTLLHPDAGRSWAEVFVVAVDLRRVRLYAVAGTREPAADSPEGEKYERSALIPAAHDEELLGAFNGGFMTEHGGYGMKIDGVTLVKPKPNACTIAVYNDDSVRIAPWHDIAADEPQMRWLRQAPECMWSQDKLHPGLIGGKGLKWGATLDGDTVIRRSAIGLNAARDVLYVSITNHSTARVLADGMHHCGAVDVAQLDVNWSYPKFVTFEPGDSAAERKAVALADGFEYSPDEYIRKKQRRDFFYLMRKDTGLQPPTGYVAPSSPAVAPTSKD
ncbi:MAG TPA: hypothetical protein VHB79_39065 [Polyangiaceae bacterium]|nr:hypothetical protein [Polyangiaceae bacterium]